MTDILLKLPQVQEKTALSRSSIYQKISTCEFPPPIRLGVRAVAWRSSDIQRWIDERPEVRLSGQGGVF